MAKTSGKSSGGKSGGGKSGGGKSGAADKTSKVVAPAPKVAEALLSTADEKDSWDESALDDNEYARFVTRNEEAGEDTSDIDTNLASLDPDAELSEGDGETSGPNGAEASEDELSEDELSEDGSTAEESSEDEVVSEDGSTAEESSEDEVSEDGSTAEEASEDELSEEELSEDGVSEDGSTAEESSEEELSEEEIMSEDEIAPDAGDWTEESSEADWVDLSDSDPAAE